MLFKKYCDYQRFNLYHELRKGQLEGLYKKDSDKEQLVRRIVDAETNWRAVFESVGITLFEEEKAELEFRKALYKHKFDRVWCNEI